MAQPLTCLLTCSSSVKSSSSGRPALSMESARAWQRARRAPYSGCRRSRGYGQIHTDQCADQQANRSNRQLRDDKDDHALPLR